MFSLRPVVSFCFIFASISSAISQSSRTSCVVFTDLKYDVYSTWKAEQNSSLTLTAFSTIGGGDSVIVSRNDQKIGSFFAKHGKIVSSRLVLTDESGAVQSIDSFHLSQDYFPARYFGYYTAVAVKWEYYPNGIPRKMHRKTIAGADSVVMEWSEKGILRRKMQDETEYGYSPNGILQSETAKGDKTRMLTYHLNGVLASVTMDTVIKNQLVKLVRNYSEKGIIQKESWFKDTVPCETWRVYDSKGAVIKTIRYAPLPVASALPEVVALYEPEFFMFVEQRVDFPGGREAFFKFMQIPLETIFCGRKKRFSGSYTILFEIQEDGKAVYISSKGSNAAEIEPLLKQAIESSPRWKAAKRLGVPITEGLALVIQVP